jgi:hypothetical protein
VIPVIPSTIIGVTSGVGCPAAGLGLPRSFEEWHPAVDTRPLDPGVRDRYDEPYSPVRQLHPATVHALAAREKRISSTTTEEFR